MPRSPSTLADALTADVVHEACLAVGASQRLDCQLVSRHSALSHASAHRAAG
jgi:hypothetical protein